jgi:hypothetical protein
MAASQEQRPTIKVIEQKVKEVRAFLAQGWDADQLERRRAA